jgi:hypothetical protein
MTTLYLASAKITDRNLLHRILLPHAATCQWARSNGLSEVIRARCYYDQACLAVTEHSNGCGDGIGPLLL